MLMPNVCMLMPNVCMPMLTVPSAGQSSALQAAKGAHVGMTVAPVYSVGISIKETSACMCLCLGKPAQLTGWYYDSWLLAARCCAG